MENLRIVPVFGAGALNVPPRIGHLHIAVDDLPWWWADASDNNTVDVAGLPPGEHKVRIKLVDPNHNVFPGQVVTLTFTVRARDRAAHQGMLATRKDTHYPLAPSSQSAASVRAARHRSDTGLHR